MHQRKNSPFTTITIQTQVRSIFNNLVSQNGESSTGKTFNASKGWLERFKRHYNLHNIKMTGEAASGDKETAIIYPEVL